MINTAKRNELFPFKFYFPALTQFYIIQIGILLGLLRDEQQC